MLQFIVCQESSPPSPHSPPSSTGAYRLRGWMWRCGSTAWTPAKEGLSGSPTKLQWEQGCKRYRESWHSWCATVRVSGGKQRETKNKNIINRTYAIFERGGNGSGLSGVPSRKHYPPRDRPFIEKNVRLKSAKGLLFREVEVAVSEFGRWPTCVGLEVTTDAGAPRVAPQSVFDRFS